MKKFPYSLQGTHWANPLMRRNRDGKIHSRGAKPRVSVLKIHHESQKACYHSCASHKFFPTSGLAGVVEKTNCTTSGEATSGAICFPPQLLSHEWGKNCDAHRNGNMPWVKNGVFYPSLFLLIRGLTFHYCESENELITTLRMHVFALSIVYYQYTTASTVVYWC